MHTKKVLEKTYLSLLVIMAGLSSSWAQHGEVLNPPALNDDITDQVMLAHMYFAVGDPSQPMTVQELKSLVHRDMNRRYTQLSKTYDPRIVSVTFVRATFKNADPMQANVFLQAKYVDQTVTTFKCTSVLALKMNQQRQLLSPFFIDITPQQVLVDTCEKVQAD